jgi:hypothetical protein
MADAFTSTKLPICTSAASEVPGANAGIGAKPAVNADHRIVDHRKRLDTRLAADARVAQHAVGADRCAIINLD